MKATPASLAIVAMLRRYSDPQHPPQCHSDENFHFDYGLLNNDITSAFSLSGRNMFWPLCSMPPFSLRAALGSPFPSLFIFA